MSKKRKAEYPIIGMYVADVHGERVLVKRYASVRTPEGSPQFDDIRPPEVDPMLAAGYLNLTDEELP